MTPIDSVDNELGEILKYGLGADPLLIPKATRQITQLINQKVLEGRILGGIEELNNIQLEYGHYMAQTCIDGEWLTIHERIAELKAELSSAVQPPNTDTLTKGER